MRIGTWLAFACCKWCLEGTQGGEQAATTAAWRRTRRKSCMPNSVTTVCMNVNAYVK